MKNTLIAASIIIYSGSALMAHAESNGTITFNGLVTDTTCDVSVNGQGADATIQLPTVSSSLLAAKGSVTGRTSFNMELTNCTLGTATGDTVSQVAAFFQDGATVDVTTGHLKQQDQSGAMNVSLELLDGTTFQPIKVGDSSQISDSTYYAMTEGVIKPKVLETIDMPYAVQYFADGQATSGVVTSSVVYNLMYK